MRCACVDVGSNTTRLLVAEPAGGPRPGRGAVRPVLELREFTHLRRGAVGAAAVARVAAAVAAQVEAARAVGAASVRVVATAAIRAAPNREELCAAIASAAGTPVEVLDGDEEAALAFAGATATLETHDARAPAPTPTERIGVVDVGGGSTELVCGTLAGGVAWSASVPIGSGVLADAFLHADPPGAAELAALTAHVRERLAVLDCPRPRAAYAVGGSATSLRRVLGDELSPAALRGGLALLCAHPAARTAERLGIDAQRARLLPAGIVLLAEAASLLGVHLRVARGGLREGVVLRTWAEHGQGS